MPPPLERRVTAVLGPTNTGKTFLAVERMLGHSSGMIGFPLRLLARENYDRIVALKGARAAALVTGEEKIVPPQARYFVCTVESMPLDRPVRVIDGRIDMAPETTVIDATRHALCLGVTVLTGAPILDALRVTRAAKTARPDLPVVWGGWHPSLLAEQCLASGVVDACVTGQGERGFAEIVEALESGTSFEKIAGVVWRRGDEIVKNPPRPSSAHEQRSGWGITVLVTVYRPIQ